MMIDVKFVIWSHRDLKLSLIWRYPWFEVICDKTVNSPVPSEYAHDHTYNHNNNNNFNNHNKNIISIPSMC